MGELAGKPKLLPGMLPHDVDPSEGIVEWARETKRRHKKLHLAYGKPLPMKKCQLACKRARGILKAVRIRAGT